MSHEDRVLEAFQHGMDTHDWGPYDELCDASPGDWLVSHVNEWLAKIGPAIQAAFDGLAIAVQNAMAWLTRAGWFRPDVETVGRGGRWTNPLTGEVWQVRGSTPAMWHWTLRAPPRRAHY